MIEPPAGRLKSLINDSAKAAARHTAPYVISLVPVTRTIPFFFSTTAVMTKSSAMTAMTTANSRTTCHGLIEIPLKSNIKISFNTTKKDQPRQSVGLSLSDCMKKFTNSFPTRVLTHRFKGTVPKKRNISAALPGRAPSGIGYYYIRGVFPCQAYANNLWQFACGR